MKPEEIEALATRLHNDANARRHSFQWFLFFLPFIWGIIYGLLYMILHP